MSLGSQSPSAGDETTQVFRLNFSPGTTDTIDTRYLPTTESVMKGGGVAFTFDPLPEADGDGEELRLEFEEEALGVSAKHGFGYLQVEFGDCIGPENQYQVLRKLDFGMQASVWLAKDTLNNRFVAIKALTGFVTEIFDHGIPSEADIMGKISLAEKDATKTHCLSLLDTFVQPGKDEGDGKHLCIVTNLLGPTVASFRRSTGQFAIPLLKKILRDVLKGLDHLHSFGIAHTNLRSDKIMTSLETDPRALDIETFLRDNPSERHPPELTEGKKFVRAAKSQPLPLSPAPSWSSLAFIIGDFGNAQFLDNKVNKEITPIDLRPPVVFLELAWDEKVDIWTFGCMIFELISGQRLFDSTAFGLPENSSMVYQMLLYTGERFPREICDATIMAWAVLDPDTGRLKRDVPHSTITLYQRCKDSFAWDSADDLEGVVALMKKCLRLDPKTRASAKELLQDPWLNHNV